MSQLRKEQVSKNTDGYYHCVNRAVCRAYLRENVFYF